MSALPKPDPYLTEADYLAYERDSDTKHEYLDGQIVAMTGASQEHNLIVTNIIGTLYAQLRKTPCRVYPSDMRLKIEAYRQYTYPDISGVCDDPILTDDHLDTYINPIFIIEVLSPSTAHYDRGPKFHAYKSIPTLQDYLLISQDQAYIEYFRRDTNRWIYTDAIGLDASLSLASINCTLTLADVYERVSFETED